MRGALVRVRRVRTRRNLQNATLTFSSIAFLRAEKKDSGGCARRIKRSGNRVVASAVFNMNCDLSTRIRLSTIPQNIGQGFGEERRSLRDAATGTNTLAVASFAMGD